MSRLWLLPAALACLVVSGVCAYMARPQAVGSLEATPAAFDAGEVSQGETVPVEFRLTNHYPRSVEITDVSTSCACTDADLKQRKLTPGETAVLKANWRTGASRGARATGLIVAYKPAGKSPERLSLRIQGDVIPDLQVSPERLEFKKGVGGSQTVAISPGRMADGAATKAWCTHKAFSASLESPTRIVVTFDPAKWTTDDDNLPPAGVGELEIETTSPHQPVCRIPLDVLERRPKD